MQARSESKKKLQSESVLQHQQQQLHTEGHESPTTTNLLVVSLAHSKQDPESQAQMSSVQSLVTLQGHLNSKGSGGQRTVTKEQLSAGEIDDFSLFQQPMEGGPQETEVNNTFHEINQSVDQGCQDDPDFQSILSNRMQAQPVANDKQTEEQKTAAQEALLQQASRLDESASSSQNSREEQAIEQVAQNTHVSSSIFQEEQSKLQAQHQRKQQVASQNESSKTARMMQKVSFMHAQNEVAHQRTSKSSTRQKRPQQGFALPTFSNENSQTQQFELDQNFNLALHQQETSQAQQQKVQNQHQHNQMMQSLQQKLHINLKNLPSTSGGSSSYSNKDLSERLQGLMWQQRSSNQGGNAASGVSPGLKKPGSYMQWQTDHLDLDSSNRTGTDRDDPMLLSGQPIAATMTGNINMPPPIPANMSQDPYFYLQWRQQKHKSCRSAHPNHQANYLLAQRKAASPGANARTLRLNQGKGRSRGTAKNCIVNDSTSTYSNSSQTTVPVKSLNEVKNPSNLITFRFVNRKVTHLNDIGRFRNLTELDVNGNLLKSGVPELLKLPFLKKLNLSDNQITEMWSLPTTLEILNISYNCLKRLDSSVMSSLTCLTTLEISNNGIESLDGLQSVPRLKRLIARNNQIQNLSPIFYLTVLIEMDFENNPIDSATQVLKAVQNKKDILMLNLKLAPLMVKVQSYNEFISSVCGATQRAEDGSEQKVAQDFKKLLTFLHNGTFYRRKRVYLRLRQQQQSLYVAERRFSNFSNDADSSNEVTPQQQDRSSGGAFKNLSGSGKNQRNNSTGLQYNNKRVRQGSNPQRSQRYEAIISLYDKLLEEEDKLLVQRRKKEARERKLQRQLNGDQEHNQSKTGGFNSEDEDLDDDDDNSVDLDEEDDLDDLLSDEDIIEDPDCCNQSYGGEENLSKGGVDLDDLQTYHNQHFGVELNASTADFNKEIKQINQQLLNEGHLVATTTDQEDTTADIVSPKKGSSIKTPQISPSQTVTAKHQHSKRQQPSNEAQSSPSPEVVAVVQSQAMPTQPSEPNSPALQDELELDSSAASNELSIQSKQVGGSVLSDQIDTQEISVVVPLEERSSRYTNRQHQPSVSHGGGAKELESSVIRSTVQPLQAAMAVNHNHPENDQSPMSQDTTGVDQQYQHFDMQPDLASQDRNSFEPNDDSQAKSSSGQSKKAPLSFKLDLAKVQNQGHLSSFRQGPNGGGDLGSSNRKLKTTTNRGGSITTGQFVQVKKVKPGETSVRYPPNHEQLMSVRKIQNQMQLAQISERIPIKKAQKSLNVSANDIYPPTGCVETSYMSAQIVKKQKPLPVNNSKQVHIPKLALQNIHRQPSEQSHNSQAWQQTNQVAIGTSTQKGTGAKQVMPKSLKVLTLSKREDSMASNEKSGSGQQVTAPPSNSLTIKQSQITKTLQGKELLDLYEKINTQRKLIDDTKRALGDVKMTDASIVDRIVALQASQQTLLVEKNHYAQQLVDRHQMQLEDLNGQILRLQGQLEATKPLPQRNNKNYLEQLEQLKETTTTQQKTNGNLNKSSGRRGSYPIEGGLTLRLRENSNKISLGGAENQAILDLLKTQTSGTGKLAKTGRGPILQQNLLEQSAIDPRLKLEQRQTSIGKHTRNNSKVNNCKNSSRHSRHDSGGNAFELSSKREFMDLCQSPVGILQISDFQNHQDSTLERASNQDDLLGGVGASTEKDIEKNRSRIVSDFNPAVADAFSQRENNAQSSEHQQIKRTEKSTKAVVQPLRLKAAAGVGGDGGRATAIEESGSKQHDNRDDSFRRVGFFLEKIKERNSSLQERLNLSFKKSSRLDQSSISYRPTTSFGGNKQKLRGTLIERECISLTRETDSIQMGLNPHQPQQSKTPNILNMQQQTNSTIEVAKEENSHRVGSWKGLKPQLASATQQTHQKHAQANQPQQSSSIMTQQSMLKKQQRVSPTNNYMEFLQTGQVENLASQPHNNTNRAPPVGDSQRNSAYQQQQQVSILSVFEEAKQLTHGLKKQNQPVVPDSLDKDPFYNFNQCTEVLYQLSTTSRGRNNPSSSCKNRGLISQQQSKQALSTQGNNISQQYSSLLKQRSNNAIAHPSKTSVSMLVDHTTTATKANCGAVKQGTTSTSFIQRANSHEMVPRLTPKHNNYITTTTTPSHLITANAANTTQQAIVHHNHQSSHGAKTLSGYWTQLEPPSLDISRTSYNNNNAEGGCAGPTQTMMQAQQPQQQAQQIKHNPTSILNKSLQTYQRLSKGLNNSITAGSATSGLAYGNSQAAYCNATGTAAQPTTQPLQPPSTSSSKHQAKSGSKQPMSSSSQPSQTQQSFQKVLGAKNMVQKLQLQLKGLGQQASATSSRIPAGRKTVQTDRARYQSNNIDVANKRHTKVPSQLEI